MMSACLGCRRDSCSCSCCPTLMPAACCLHTHLRRCDAAMLPPPLLPQDAALRKKVDERREEAELRREFEVAAAQEERERQWRIARGEATAADLVGPAAAGPASRDTWMTELPPERRTDGPPVMPTVGALVGSAWQTGWQLHCCHQPQHRVTEGALASVDRSWRKP
jgi:hypothetical protein